MPTTIPLFSEVFRKASELLSQLQTVKDSIVTYQTLGYDEQIFTFVASLDTSNNSVRLIYDVTLNNEPVRLLAELPPTVLADYGIFISRVQHWENGGEMHESLRHDD
jgi:hypothetical protein